MEKDSFGGPFPYGKEDHSPASDRRAVITRTDKKETVNEKEEKRTVENEVVSRINSLQTLVMGIITAAGAIVLAWGVFDFAAGYQAHDTSQQTQSLKKVVAGILMLLAQSVVNMLS